MAPQDSSPVSRRTLIKSTAATVLAASVAANAASTQRTATATARQTPRRRANIALQLYSVRNDCAKDPEGTIAAVAKMGYQAVEFAGYYGKTAKELRKILDDNGLRCCGTHAQFDTLLDDRLPETIEFNKTIGNEFLIVPGLPSKYTASLAAWEDAAKIFNDLAEKVKPHAMHVGYHNHSAEFQAIDGRLPWDVFMSNTSKDVVMQLDLGNAMGGGADPLPYLYRYPARALTVHLKEFSKTNPDAIIGDGDVPWRAFFALCRAVGETRWYIVEYEREGQPALQSVDLCLKNLRKMPFV